MHVTFNYLHTHTNSIVWYNVCKKQVLSFQPSSVWFVKIKTQIWLSRRSLLVPFNVLMLFYMQADHLLLLLLSSAPENPHPHELWHSSRWRSCSCLCALWLDRASVCQEARTRPLKGTGEPQGTGLARGEKTKGKSSIMPEEAVSARQTFTHFTHAISAYWCWCYVTFHM